MVKNYEENYYVLAVFPYGDVSKSPIWGGFIKGKDSLIHSLEPEGNPLLKRFHNSRETSDAENEFDLGLELRITRVSKEIYDKADEIGLAGALCVWDKQIVEEVKSDEEYITDWQKLRWMILNLPKVVYLVIESIFRGVVYFMRTRR